MADIRILCIVEPRRFPVDIDADEWAAMNTEDREDWIYECAQEFGAFTVRYEEPLP